MKTPRAKTVKTVCAVCELDWKAHGTKPTLETCVDLLKAELAKRPEWPQQFLGESSGNPYAWPTTTYTN